jgi:hypothetical protein
MTRSVSRLGPVQGPVALHSEVVVEKRVDVREKGTQSPLSTPEGYHPLPSTFPPSHPAPPSPYLPWPSSNPRGFPRERFSSLGGSRSAQSPNSKPCFIPPTNPPDSPPVELDTCCLPSRTQESPSELPRRQTRSSPPPAVSPRCWSRLDASPGTRTGVPPRCCRRRGRGLSGRTTTPSLPPPPPPAYLTTPRPAHTLTSPGPSREGDQALLDRGIPKRHLIP